MSAASSKKCSSCRMPCAPGRDLAADEHARKVIGPLVGAEAVEQRERADAEEQMQELTAALEPAAYTARKCRGSELRGRGGDHSAEDAVLAQNGKHFAGHLGLEGNDRAFAHHRPLAVRARQDRERWQRVVGHRARDLRLLAAHHVRRPVGVAAEKTRHDPDRTILRAHNATRQRRDRSRTMDVGCFDPALAAADHPAGEARRRVATPIPEERSERLGIGVPDLLDAQRRRAPVKHRAMVVEAIRPCRRRAPVEADQRRGPSPHAPGSGATSQRAAASSSLARASTHRAPSGVSSFFQNGARVLR